MGKRGADLRPAPTPCPPPPILGEGELRNGLLLSSPSPEIRRGGQGVGARALHRSGFTLVEVLVAAAVLAIGISAGVRTLGAMERASAGAADRQTAVRLAGERLALIEGVEGVSAGSTQGQFDSEPRFRWQQQVGAATSETGVLEVTVTITWQDGDATRHYAVTTYLLDPAQLQQNQSSTGGGA
jgi:type II secretion system protein I